MLYTCMHMENIQSLCNVLCTGLPIDLADQVCMYVFHSDSKIIQDTAIWQSAILTYIIEELGLTQEQICLWPDGQVYRWVYIYGIMKTWTIYT